MIKSYLVDLPPVFKVMGTSVTHPIIFTREPGLLLLSESGETNSSLRNTLILFDCAPSNSSGDSSNTKPCPSTNSLEISLNLPFLPHLHLLGSLYLVSNCKTDKIFPQLGHSNLAVLTCGRTSDFCLTIPSTQISLFRFLLLIALMVIFCDSGRFFSLTVNFTNFFGRANSLMAISAAFSSSSGFSRISSEISLLTLISSEKSRISWACPFLTASSNWG